jgi:nitrous oxidase accessory protein
MKTRWWLFPASRIQWRFIGFSLLVCLALSNVSTAMAQPGGQTVKITAEMLATVISQADDGDTIEVSGGVYHGSLEIDKRLNLVGTDWPILDGGDKGTVLKITGPGATVRGFLIKNSGSSLDQENAGIAVEAADVLVEGNRFEGTLFGIYLRRAPGSTIRGNVISSKDLDVPRRGDPIRVWYSNDVLVEDNVISKGRDVVLWYSERLTIRRNEVSNGRYGLHFMYCDDANVHHNRLLNNSVGAFMMYSRRVTLQNNTIAYNRGPSGYGIGLKDMDDTIVKENLFLDNRIGAHLDTSPREVDSIGQFTGNVFAYNDIGIQMMPSVRHNEFTANSFVDNGEQVAIAGGGQLLDNAWAIGQQGNYWSDYAGYDVDTDGVGDIDYKSERLYEDLVQRHPELRLFLYSPATNAIDFAAKAFPLVRPQPKLTDDHPLMAPRIPADAPLLPQTTNHTWYAFSILLILILGGLVWLPRLGWQRYQFTFEAD